MGFVISNPQPQEHRQFVTQALKNKTFNSMDEPQSLAEGLGMGLGLVLGTAVIEVLIDQAEYQNFFFFSILSSPDRSLEPSIKKRKPPFDRGR